MFRELADARGLADTAGYTVEPLTPLLALADGRTLDPALRGELPGGGDGVVGRLSFDDAHAEDAKGGRSFEFLVVITRVPESAPLVPRLFCRRRGRADTNFGMGFELDGEALWTESVALSERYEVATSPYQDENWMRQLFAPAFIDWLVTHPPKSFAFELAYGDLVGSVEVGNSSAEHLAALWDATGAVAKRIRDECDEEV